MNCREIYNALEKDLPKVKYRTQYMMPKVVKELKKESKFPAWRICKYTAPESGFKYNLCYYAEFPVNAQRPTNMHYSIMDTDGGEAIIRTVEGQYIKPDGNVVDLKQIYLYTHHFLERYNDRFLKNPSLTYDEIACMFSCRNKIIIPTKMNEKINRNYAKHGRFNSHVYEVRDGVCFALTAFEDAKDENGNLIPNDEGTLLVIYTTFMKENDMSDEQLKAIEDEQKILFKTIDKLFLRNLVE